MGVGLVIIIIIIIIIKIYSIYYIFLRFERMLFTFIDKIKKYVNNASDDAQLVAIICGSIALITYCNYKDKKIASE